MTYPNTRKLSPDELIDELMLHSPGHYDHLMRENIFPYHGKRKIYFIDREVNLAIHDLAFQDAWNLGLYCFSALNPRYVESLPGYCKWPDLTYPATIYALSWIFHISESTIYRLRKAGVIEPLDDPDLKGPTKYYDFDRVHDDLQDCLAKKTLSPRLSNHLAKRLKYIYVERIYLR